MLNRGRTHRGVDRHGLEGVPLGLLGKLDDAARVVDLHQPEVGGAVALDGESADGDVGVGGAVVLDELEVVHAVEVVAREDDDVLDGAVLFSVGFFF